jgi:hypothetical protein
MPALFAAAASLCFAGPKDFGLSELNRAMALRGMQLGVKVEMTTEPPETFQIEPYPAGGGARIDGGDLRGLMYGLIEAAEQIRTTGKFARAHGEPAIAMRGVRVAIAVADLDHPEDWWRGYLQMLALDRFNRFTLALDRAPVEADFRKLRALSQSANDVGLDFILGVPSSAGDLKAVLDACPMIRGIQVAGESVPLDAIYQSLRGAGRLVTLDLRGALRTPAEMRNAEKARVRLRLPAAIEGPLPDNADAVRRRLGTLDPAGFEIEAPTATDLDLLRPLFALWGRLGYDPKAKPLLQ